LPLRQTFRVPLFVSNFATAAAYAGILSHMAPVQTDSTSDPSQPHLL